MSAAANDGTAAVDAGAYDVVVVGAGVSGLYAALRLGRAGRRVLLLERARRAGGRVLSEHCRGHVLEYGPMRFIPALQRRFEALVRRELRLRTAAFPPYSASGVAPPDANALAFDEVRAVHDARRVLPPAFALLAHGLGALLGDQWDVAHDDAAAPGREARKAWLRRHGAFQGRLLHAHGIWDCLAHVLSKAALDYLQVKGTFYHVIHLNPNAADCISFLLDVLATARAPLVAVDGGAQRITDALRERLEAMPNVALRLGAAVAELRCRSADDGGTTADVELVLEDGSTVRARAALLTCQAARLRALRGMPPPLAPLLRSVFLVKLFKVFAVLEDPPWGARDVPPPNFGADKLPCREVHYSYSEESATGLVMVRGTPLAWSVHAIACLMSVCVRAGDRLADLRRRAVAQLLVRLHALRLRRRRRRRRRAADQRQRALAASPHVLSARHLLRHHRRRRRRRRQLRRRRLEAAFGPAGAAADMHVQHLALWHSHAGAGAAGRPQCRRRAVAAVGGVRDR